METTTKKARQSNFEALRIVAMAMIVTYHYYLHGVQHAAHPQLRELFLQGSLSHRLITMFFLPGGNIGVAVFFMLTGYFMCQSEWKLQRLKKLFLQSLFYSLILFALYAVLKTLGVYSFPYTINPEWANSTGGYIAFFIRSVIPISSGAWWFITAYVVLFALIPALNKVIASVSFRRQVAFTAVFWALWYAAGYLGFAYTDIRRAVFFYLLGALLRKTKPKGSKWLFLVLFVLSWFLLFAHSVFFTFHNMDHIDRNIALKMLKILCFYSRDAVLLPAASVTLFEFFRRLDIGQNKAINTVSSATFGVYLIHDSAVGRDLLWNKVFHCLDVQYQSSLYPLLLMATCLAVFIGCAAIDLGRQWLFRAVGPRLSHKGH